MVRKKLIKLDAKESHPIMIVEKALKSMFG